jgi:hypothetical protein
VALVREGEIVLNRGSAAEITVGDLFTVFKTGPVVRDPEKGETLGTLKEPVALVQVKRLETGFAACYPILQAEEVSVGMPAVRFKAIPTVFLDLVKSESSFSLEARLKLALPELDWMAATPEDRFLLMKWNEAHLRDRGVAMVFVLSQTELLMFNRLGQPIRRWGRQTPQPEKAAPVAEPGPRPAAPPQVDVAAGGFRKILTLDALVIGLEVTDLNGNGTPDLLFLTPAYLAFWPDMDRRREIRYTHVGFGRIMNFSLGGSGLVALNIYETDARMVSAFLQIQPDGFKALAEDINYILGFCDLDGRGQRDVLVGQRFHRERVFGTQVVRFKIEAGELVSGDALDVPRDFRLVAATFFKSGKHRSPGVAFISEHHKLVVAEPGKPPWMSGQAAGGSMQSINVQQGTDKFGLVNALDIETPPLALDLNSDGRPEFLAVYNQSAHRNLLGGFPVFESGQILLLKSTEYGPALKPFSEKLPAALQGLALHRGEVYCALVQGNLLSGEYQSFLMALPLTGALP